ncbi:MAG: cyclic nucleotide-binding domain-containing protein [Proteobacteria bacterium]|nr:cyclic nucleotide-binding domain-containing protein [Pseudomonadota bacterium]
MSLGKSAAARAEMLEKTPLSKEFSWGELEELSKYMSTETFPKGAAIFEEGDKKAFMCIIFKGKVNILKESGNENKLITYIGTGRIFGEMSVIDGSPRSATAIASEETVLIVLTRQEFDRILDEKPRMGAKILQKIAAVMSQRLRETTGVLADYLGKY